MKNKKALIIIILAIIIVAVVAGYFVCTSQTKAKTIFTSELDNVLSKLENKGGVNTQSTSMTLSGSLETENDEYKSIADMINNSKITVNSQTDYKQMTENLGIEVEAQNQKFLKGNIYYEDGNDNIYVYVDDLFDKYFKISLNDIDQDGNLKETLNALFENTSEGDKTATITKILKNEIEGNLKDEYFTQENVDGFKKSTLKLTFEQFKTLITEICSNLQKNEEFLACYKNKTEINNVLNELVETLNESNEEYNNAIIEISLYTKGILAKELCKIEIGISEEENNVKFVLNKVEDDNYEFKVNIKTDENNIVANVETLNGTIKIEKISDSSKKAVLNVNVPDLGKVTLNIEYSSVKNKELDKVDIENSVETNNLTEEDANKILQNLNKMPIGSLLGMFLGEE